jgi:polar amino acid transport system ATP-binding protein
VEAKVLSGVGLRKNLGGREVLHGIDMSLRPGKITALMGQSGSGKTTLLRALSLTEPADSGVVEVDGIRFIGADRNKWPKSPWPTVTVVFQDLFLWPHLTNRENVELPLREQGKAESASLMDEVCEDLGISCLMGRFPTEISRGQRQLVALARSLALKPRYLLLDEVSASLDVERSSTVGTLLRRNAAEGAGILVITHQALFAKSSCDHLAYMADGKIVEYGPPSILEDPQCEELKKFVASSALAL